MPFIIIPNKYFCPITKNLIEDPVRIQGDTTDTIYERAAITYWFMNHNTNPVTNLPVISTVPIVNQQDITDLQAFFGKMCTTTVFLKAVEDKDYKQVAQITYAKPHLSKSKDGQTPLHIVAKNGCLEIAELLLSNYFELIKYEASTMESKKAEKFLCTAKQDVIAMKNGQGLTPLYVAAQHNHMHLIDLFKKFSPELDVNLKCGDDGFTPLLVAALNGHVDMIKLLMKYGADPQIVGQAGLGVSHLAAASNNLKLIDFLLSDKLFNPEAKAHWGGTPLCVAVNQKSNDVVQFLLEKMHVAVDIVLKDGYTPLHIAAEANNLAAIEMLLLLAKVNVDIPNPYTGKTPLHVAAEKGRTAAAKCLISYKADVNELVSDTFDTALHLATKNNHKDIVQLLLDKGAVQQVPNCANLTCCQVALKNKNKEIYKIFIDYRYKLSNEVTTLSAKYDVITQRLDEINKILKTSLPTEKSSKSLKMIASSDNLEVSLTEEKVQTITLPKFSELFSSLASSPSPTHSPITKKPKLIDNNNTPPEDTSESGKGLHPSN